MTLACVQGQQSRSPPCGQQTLIGADHAPQLRDIIAEHLAETAGFEKIALHIDNQQGACGGLKREWIGFRLNLHHEASSPRPLGRAFVRLPPTSREPTRHAESWPRLHFLRRDQAASDMPKLGRTRLDGEWEKVATKAAAPQEQVEPPGMACFLQ